MALMGAIERQYEGLFGALDHLETLVEAAAPDGELLNAIGAVRRTLLAHELTAERFVVGPLRHLRLLDAEQLAAFGSEFDGLTAESARLTASPPDGGALTAFVRATRGHIARKARAIVPAARAALADGRLPAVPAWFVDEVYELQGGPVGHWPEEWLG